MSSILKVIVLTFLLLLVPLISMQFYEEANWNIADFIIAGALLMGAGLTFVFLTRYTIGKKHRLIIGSILLILLVVVWAELAVGIFGTRFSGD
jgi:hypothetical protein